MQSERGGSAGYHGMNQQDYLAALPAM